jgi:hypothetical protein
MVAVPGGGAHRAICRIERAIGAQSATDPDATAESAAKAAAKSTANATAKAAMHQLGLGRAAERESKPERNRRRQDFGHGSSPSSAPALTGW